MTVEYRVRCHTCAAVHDVLDETDLPTGWWRVEYEHDDDWLLTHFCCLACLATYIKARQLIEPPTLGLGAVTLTKQ